MLSLQDPKVQKNFRIPQVNFVVRWKADSKVEAIGHVDVFRDPLRSVSVVGPVVCWCIHGSQFRAGPGNLGVRTRVHIG
jgi:hypothetical protein